MALGLFRHLTLTQLTQLHADAVTALTQGKNRLIQEAGAGDTTVRKEFNLDSKTFWEELNWALELKSPGSYRPPVTRTRIKYV